MLVDAVTVSVCVEELLLGFGSVWSVVPTVAVFEYTPGLPGITRIVIVAVPVFNIVPSKQVTVPSASEHVPAVVVVESQVIVDGSVSATVMFVAVMGPLFVTVSV